MSLGPLLGLAAGGVLGTGALGVFHPRVRLFGPELSRVKTAARVVALTFDDGPDAEMTPRISETLRRFGARATFFCVGEALERNPEVARALLDAGHELANHTYGHNTGRDLFSASRLQADLEKCQVLLERVTGETCRYYRPAVGIRNPEVHRAARALGLTVVTWTAAARDGVHAFTDARARKLGEGARPGSILALHDGVRGRGREHREATLRSLPVLLETLAARGFKVATLSESLR